MPIDRQGRSLSMLPQFAKNPDAMAWLWKDHTGHAEAGELTTTAAKLRPAYLKKCGGRYSSEWFWAQASPLHSHRSGGYRNSLHLGGMRRLDSRNAHRRD